MALPAGSRLDVCVILIVCLGILYLRFLKRADKFAFPLPPGPPPLPIIGNALELAPVAPPGKFHQWKEKYGDIVHLTALGQHIVVLNSAKVIVELMEKRGRIYSSRPGSIMVELTGLAVTWTLAPYGDSLRQFHKLGRHVLGIHAMSPYESAQEDEARLLAAALIREPGQFSEHLQRFASDVLLRLLYGYSPSPELDEISRAGRKLSKEAGFLFTAAPSKVLEVLPILRHIPAWFPFFQFKKTAQDLKKQWHFVRDKPYLRVKKEMETVGNSAERVASSICATLLEGQRNGNPPFDISEEDIKVFLGSTYPPGQETTTSILHTFLLLMANHPEVQAKARAEIVSITGERRLPSLSDKEHFIYLKALFKEMLRWHSPVHLGIPHVSMEEDVYEGMRIPKGSLVISNIWELMHDPQIFPEPHLFKPERFLNRQYKNKLGLSCDPFDHVFGYGRRSCPGMYLAENTLLIAMAMILFSCEISPVTGTSQIEPEFVPSIVIHLMPYKCTITSVSKISQELLSNGPDFHHSV